MTSAEHESSKAYGANQVSNMIEKCGIVKADILKEYIQNTWKKEWDLYKDDKDMKEEDTKNLWFKADGLNALTALLKETVPEKIMFTSLRSSSASCNHLLPLQ